MSQTNRDKIVFVSHVVEDATIASEIKAWLEKKLLGGVDVFVSDDDIDPGAKWEEHIEEKLKNCCIALIVCTQTSIRQPWINFEAGGAWVKGAKVIPLCYHGQRKEELPRPLSSIQALDLSEPDDVRKLLETIATEAGLRAPDTDPNGLIERLPPRNYEEMAVNGELPDIRVRVHLAVDSDERGGVLHGIGIEAQNHDKNSVFLRFPSIAIKGSTNRLVIVKDLHHLPIPTGELKPGDSRSIIVNPAEFKLEGDLGDLEQLGEVFFSDKIGRKFKGSTEDMQKAMQAWKSATQSDKK